MLGSVSSLVVLIAYIHIRNTRSPFRSTHGTVGGTRTKISGVQQVSSSGGMDRRCPERHATQRCGVCGACSPTGLRLFGSQHERGYTASHTIAVTSGTGDAIVIS